MKALLFALSSLTATAPALAMEGSWFALGANYEYLSAGATESGTSLSMEGGYWYLGNVAYGAQVKASFMGDGRRVGASDLRVYDLGIFWKAGTDQGLYGKLITGLALFNGSSRSYRFDSPRSFYIGAGGGFLFPISDTFQIGPEVLYRHLTAGDGGDQISVGALVAYSF